MIKRVYPNKEVVQIRACYRKDYTTGERCGNGGISGELVEDTLIKAIFTTVRPLVLKATKDMAKDKKLLKAKINGSELDNLTKQERELTKQLDKLIDLQLEHKTDRITVKMRQVEAQLEIVKDRIAQLDDYVEPNDYTWVDVFLKEAEDLVGFPFNYKGLSNEQKNIFLKKYIQQVTVLNGQVVGIEYAKEVNNLLSLGEQKWKVING
jgi:hypothetical protein